ncbi:MAG: FAD-dependent oxidoreductase [Bacteroidia bacterium]|nr:FAD-dependent oxidoreductase [Bacteroidia bacterium]
MKTPLLSFIQKAIKLAQIANQPNQPQVSELIEMKEQEEKNYTRRKFLQDTAKAGALVSLSSIFPKKLLSAPPINARIAIIGGGIAGLSAAHYLKKAGIDTFTIYEGDSRTGGRIYTKKDIIGNNLLTEVGGEYIDTYHKDMFKLAKEYGLEMIDTFKDPLNLKKDAYYFEGRHYSLEEVVREFQAVLPKIQASQNALDENYTNEATQSLDYTPLAEYLEKLGASSWFTKMLDIAYTSEYGLPTGEQSSLNFIDMIDTSTSTEFKIFGISDERYKIKGGNGLLTTLMTSALQNHIQTDMRLTGVYSVGKRYQLVFNDRSSIETDIVIMCIPFSVLRNVSMQIEGMTKVKRICIDELGYGTNAKVMMGFSKRVWRNAGYFGYLFNESVHNGWDNGLFQNHPLNEAVEGGYTVYLGGEDGLKVQRGAEQELARKYVGILNEVFPGIMEHYNGKAAVADWPQNPFVNASYACYKVGQWTSISGLEMEPVGNLYFAGEHCSDESQGYMNGGAETGRMVAKTIIRKIKGKE